MQPKLGAPTWGTVRCGAREWSTLRAASWGSWGPLAPCSPLGCLDMLSLPGQFTFTADQPQLHCAVFFIGDPDEFITIHFDLVSIDCQGGDLLKVRGFPLHEAPVRLALSVPTWGQHRSNMFLSFRSSLGGGPGSCIPREGLYRSSAPGRWWFSFPSVHSPTPWDFLALELAA